MRKREREKIVENLNAVPNSKQGNSIFVRPFDSDLKMIAELAQDTGEPKSAIARKLIQRALTENQLNAKQDRIENKLDWLINNYRESRSEIPAFAEQIRHLCNSTEADHMQTQTIAKNAIATVTLLREFYCMLNITVSSLNQIFIKLLEYSSPNQAERDHSIDIGNTSLANLIGHSILDLHKCSDFHGLDLDSSCKANLYVGTKIKVLKERIAESSSNAKVKEHKKPL